MFELNDIRVVRDGRVILSVPSLTIPATELTVVLGHNGSGKSTLVDLLAGQTRPDQGEILLNNKNLTGYTKRELAQQVAFLPQKLPVSAGLTVRELVSLGRFPWRGTFGRRRPEDNIIISQAMESAGVTEFAQIPADNLSGGERQRAWVAMLLAQQSPVLILDEPTSALDIHHQYQLMRLLQDLNRTQRTGIIVILHDLNLALQYATHIIALKKGKVAFEGDAALLEDETRLSGLYETAIRLIPHPDTEQRKVAVVCN